MTKERKYTNFKKAKIKTQIIILFEFFVEKNNGLAFENMPLFLFTILS